MQEIEVHIRPLEVEDAEDVQRYASDERVASTTTIPQPYPQNGGEIFVKTAIEARENREAFPFAIIADSEMIGVIGLNRADFENRSIRCDYAIASSHWGRGITTKAVSLALNYAFSELRMEVVTSACLDRNLASRRVLEKNGFSEVEQFTYDSAKFEGEQAVRFQLTKQEWERRKAS